MQHGSPCHLGLRRRPFQVISSLLAHQLLKPRQRLSSAMAPAGDGLPYMFLFAAGSVRFIKSLVGFSIFQAIATWPRGEILSVDQF